MPAIITGSRPIRVPQPGSLRVTLAGRVDTRPLPAPAIIRVVSAIVDQSQMRDLRGRRTPAAAGRQPAGHDVGSWVGRRPASAPGHRPWCDSSNVTSSSRIGSLPPRTSPGRLGGSPPHAVWSDGDDRPSGDTPADRPGSRREQAGSADQRAQRATRLGGGAGVRPAWRPSRGDRCRDGRSATRSCSTGGSVTTSRR